MNAAALLARAARDERRIVDAFRSKGALTLGSALELRTLGLTDSRALRTMVADAIIKKAGPDRWFLDETGWASRRGITRRTMLRVAMALGVAIVAALIYFASR